MSELEPTVGPGELLVSVTLVPVEVFGGDCDCHEQRQYGTPGEVDRSCSGWSYGLMDAVESWSDCNRAIGRVYRVEDVPGAHRLPGETLTVHVRGDQVEWLRKTWGEPVENAPAVRRPCCDSAAATIEQLRRYLAELQAEIERRDTE